MFNYVKSELYRTFHRRYTYILLGAGALVLFGICLLTFGLEQTGVVRLTPNNDVTGFMFLIEVASFIMIFTYYCTMILNDCVFSDELRVQTLKNTISFGFTRTQVYWGKYIATFIMAVFSMAVLYGSYLLGTFLFYGASAGETMGMCLDLFGIQLLASFPIWLAGLSLACALSFNVSGALNIIVFLGITMAFPLVANQVVPYLFPDVAQILPYMLYNQIQHIGEISKWSQLLAPWTVGLVDTAVALLAGWLCFSRREIK